MNPCGQPPTLGGFLTLPHSSYLVDKSGLPAGGSEVGTLDRESFGPLTPHTHSTAGSCTVAPGGGAGGLCRWSTGHLPLGQPATQPPGPLSLHPTHIPSSPGACGSQALPAPPLPAGGPRMPCSPSTSATPGASQRRTLLTPTRERTPAVEPRITTQAGQRSRFGKNRLPGAFLGDSLPFSARPTCGNSAREQQGGSGTPGLWHFYSS